MMKKATLKQCLRPFCFFGVLLCTLLLFMSQADAADVMPATGNLQRAAEAGLAQQAIPPHMVVVLDRSGSMRTVRAETGNTRCQDAITLAGSRVNEFFNNHSNGKVAIWTFAGLGHSELTGFVDKTTAFNALQGLNPTGCSGSTPLADALCEAASALVESGADTKIIQLSSDGDENSSLGRCAGPASVSDTAPYDDESWHQKVWNLVVGFAIVNVDFFGTVQFQEFDSETGTFNATNAVPIMEFLQNLAFSSDGSYVQVGDSEPPVPVPSPTPIPQPDIEVEPTSLSATQGPDQTVQRSVTIHNRGDGELAWTKANNNPNHPSWLTVEPASGSVAANASEPFTVTFDTTALAGGTYTGTLTINSNDPDDPALDIPLWLTVISNQISLTLPLEAGWNLISFPVHPGNTDITKALDSIDGNYEIVYSHNGCDTATPWKIYDPNADPFVNTLTQVHEKMALWINMTTADELVVNGVLPHWTSLSLCSGWNLVGHPSLEERPLPEALDSIDGAYTIVQSHEAADSNDPWKIFDSSAPPYANSLSQMQPSKGYWINSKQDVNLIVSNP